MNAHQLEQVANLRDRKAQLEIFLTEIAPKLDRAFAKAKAVLVAFADGQPVTDLPPRLGRDLDAVIESLRKSEECVRKQSALCTTGLADLAMQMTASPTETASS